jgi:hypothetical protein
MGLPLNQLQSGLHQALQPPPEPEQTVQVLNPGTALIGHTFEVYDRQFREWHVRMVSARRNLFLRNLGLANDQQHIVILDAMDRLPLDGLYVSTSRVS